MITMLRIMSLKLFLVYGGLGLMVRDGIRYHVIMNSFFPLVEETVRSTCQLLH